MIRWIPLLLWVTLRSVHSMSVVDFEQFAAGEFVLDLGDGVAVVAHQPSFPGVLVPARAMTFNSSHPTGDDFDLGSPHESLGGPGMGAAGQAGELFANAHAHGMVLIISEDDNAENPDDNDRGGSLTFTFNPPRYVDSIGLLDNEETTTIEIHTTDRGFSRIRNDNGGDNSYELVSIHKPSVYLMVVAFKGSAALTHLALAPTEPDCPTFQTIDFDEYATGAAIAKLGDVKVRAWKRHVLNGPLVAATAMIFNSSHVTGDDADLGSPHRSFRGPGVGNGGKKGALFANKVAHGQILILSEDDDASDPDDNQYGGSIRFTFATPTVVNAMGLLDNDEGLEMLIFTSDGGKTTISNYNGGNNSYERMAIGKPGVTKLVVNFLGSGAITHFELAECP